MEAASATEAASAPPPTHVAAAADTNDEAEDAPMLDENDDEDEEDSDGNIRSFVLMRLAEALRSDISPVACLSCFDEGRDRNRAACPCFATLHPFCDLFHTWLCHRLIDDGAGTCCLLPTQVICDPELEPDVELEAAERDRDELLTQAAAEEQTAANAEEASSEAPVIVEQPSPAPAIAPAAASDTSSQCDATRFHVRRGDSNVAPLPSHHSARTTSTPAAAAVATVGLRPGAADGCPPPPMVLPPRVVVMAHGRASCGRRSAQLSARSARPVCHWLCVRAWTAVCFAVGLPTI
jgi:hypothetical protein